MREYVLPMVYVISSDPFEAAAHFLKRTVVSGRANIYFPALHARVIALVKTYEVRSETRKKKCINKDFRITFLAIGDGFHISLMEIHH